MKYTIDPLGGTKHEQDIDIDMIPCKDCGEIPNRIVIGYGSTPYMIFCKCSSKSKIGGVGGWIGNAIIAWNKVNKLQEK